MASIRVLLRSPDVPSSMPDDEAFGYSPDAEAPFPVEAIDDDGQILAAGSIGGGRPCRLTFDLPAGQENVVVKMTWPTGRVLSKRVDVDRRSESRVEFDSSLGDAEDVAWPAWSNARVARGEPGDLAEAKFRFDRLGNAALKLWHRGPENWEESSFDFLKARTFDSDQAIELNFGDTPGQQLLQIGGSGTPKTFVSLPGAGRPVRAVITAEPSTHPYSSTIRAVVSSGRPEAEMMAEFLCRDDVASAGQIWNASSVARQLLQYKFRDPLSAMVGAYWLLRSGDWPSIDMQWFDNLHREFPEIPDGALIRCALHVRKGIQSPANAQDVIDCLSDCLTSGMPVYEEAHRLLNEVCPVVRALAKSDLLGNRRGVTELLEQADSLRAARAWTGASFAFYGELPSAPSRTKVIGRLTGRRQRHPDDLKLSRGIASQEAAPSKKGNFYYDDVTDAIDSFLADAAYFQLASPSSPRSKPRSKGTVVLLKDLKRR